VSIRERVARFIAPGLKGEDEIRAIVADEIEQARAALPVTANYDPDGEGYRRLTGTQVQRDLSAITQERMFEIAYFMFDNSAMTKRLAKLDKTFLFAEPITVTADDEDVQTTIDRFWKKNRMKLEFADLVMWLGVLGEQCWPVEVNPINGDVTLGYADPGGIKQVLVSRMNVKRAVRVDLYGTAGRSGKKMAIIREDENSLSKDYGRLVGDCFFYAINHPPNSPRGRSDFLTLFDWIDGLERYGFNYLERAEFLLNFVWDVALKGMNADEIREWLRDNPAPEPGSMRAHNENVVWSAVSPDIKAHDFAKGFDMGKSFVMGAAGRPDSWFGGGGKAYQTEAEQFGQVPIKDLDERQALAGSIVEDVVRFQIDRKVAAGVLTEKQAEAGFKVNLPEISKNDFSKIAAGVPQFTAALAVAEQNLWIGRDTATRIFAQVAGQLGVEVSAEEEIEKAAARPGDVTEDYE